MPPPDEQPFEIDSLPNMEVGSTTRAEIEQRFVEHGLQHGRQSFGGDRVWVYHATSAGWSFLICGGGGFGPFGCDAAQNVRNSYLILRFDQDGVLSRYDVATVHWGCRDGGICRHGNGATMMLDDPMGRPWIGPRHGELLSSASGCPVFLYVSIAPLYNAELPLLVRVDDTLIGGLTHKRGFFLHEVGPGTHTLRTWLPKTEIPSPSAEITFECAAPAPIYAHTIVDHGFWGGTNLDIVLEDARTGIANLNEKSLALARDTVAEDYE